MSALGTSVRVAILVHILHVDLELAHLGLDVGSALLLHALAALAQDHARFAWYMSRRWRRLELGQRLEVPAIGERKSLQAS